MTSIASDLRAVATLHRNPLLVRGIRARMRLKHILSWGAVTVSITAFIWFLIYLTGTERQYLDHVEAAKLVIPPIIVIQGIILFVLGTGAVASGLADERADRSLDYQRMSPMPPTAKILGYLFGLPAREYFLFALTLPFLYAAVHISGLPLIKLAHFYLVFFSSVWLYHMTGFVAGMASSKPRRAAMTSLGLVATLYLVLPQLKYVGLNFFQYLTVRPTFVRLITEELNKINPGLEVAARRSIPRLRHRDAGLLLRLDHPPHRLRAAAAGRAARGPVRRRIPQVARRGGALVLQAVRRRPPMPSPASSSWAASGPSSAASNSSIRSWSRSRAASGRSPAPSRSRSSPWSGS
jgi:hypothetical protein